MSRVRDRIFSGIKFTALEKISIQVLSAATFFIVVNTISLTDFGLFTLLYTFVSVATTLTWLGIDRLVVADIAVYRAQEAYGTIRKLITEYSVSSALVLVGVIVLGWILRDFADQFYEANLTVYFWILVSLIAVQTATQITNVIFESHEKFSYSFTQNLIEAAMRLVIISSYFLWFGFSLQSVLWAYVLSKLFALLCAIPLMVRTVEWTKDVTPSHSILVPVLRKHGKWEMSLTGLETIINNGAPWIIHALVSTEGVALYAFVMKINSMLIRTLPVRSALFPILVHSIEKSRELACRIITKGKKYLFLVYVCFYLLMLALAEPVIDTLALHYHAAVSLLMLSMLRLFIDALSLGQSPVFYALKKQKIVFILGLISHPSMLVAQFVGTLYFGVGGTIAATLIVALLFVIIREYILASRYHFPITTWRALVTFDTYDRMLLQAVRKKLKI